MPEQAPCVSLGGRGSAFLADTADLLGLAPDAVAGLDAETARAHFDTLIGWLGGASVEGADEARMLRLEIATVEVVRDGRPPAPALRKQGYEIATTHIPLVLGGVCRRLREIVRAREALQDEAPPQPPPIIVPRPSATVPKQRVAPPKPSPLPRQPKPVRRSRPVVGVTEIDKEPFKEGPFDRGVPLEEVEGWQELLGLPEGDDPHWYKRGLCAQTDPEVFFPERGESIRPAKRICLDCEVRSDCLRDALETGDLHGIRGGLLPKERRRLLKTWQNIGA